MKTFIVTVQQVITTEIEVSAETAAAARRWVDKYGPAQAAADMAADVLSAIDRIKSVRELVRQ